tara:strand:+ start:3316 stop:4800 length:1485 start_codon:yes stop_codon:yes gene_type:complete
MNDTRHAILKELISFGKDFQKTHIADLHHQNSIENRNIKHDLLNFDYSKQRVDDEVLDYLIQIPDLIDLKESLAELFSGHLLNPSEERGVSHTLYRKKTSVDNFELIFTERNRVKEFLERNTSNGPVKDLICISIGGSRLGSELLYEFQSLNDLTNIHFCSSYDLYELKDILENCQQTETIVFACSKSFETSEIIKNLNYVKSWFLENPNVNFQDHLFGISSNVRAMTAYGIKENNQFIVLDSLGGRFSLWSSISLPAFVNSSYDSYQRFLEGAQLADEHTSLSSWESNIPVIMALLSIWNANSLNINNHGIFTYSFRLRSLTKYIAQLAMESNGKSVNFQSEVSPFKTTPLIWGGYGVELQHSTFQWLMQGKTHTSCDFVGINDQRNESTDSQAMLLSQVVAMTYGEKNKDQPFKSIRGNNPCSIVQLNSYDLKNLGFLLALYEHKTFIEALILGVDPFDQWGVQLGKKLATNSKNNEKFLADYFSSEFLPKS